MNVNVNVDMGDGRWTRKRARAVHIVEYDMGGYDMYKVNAGCEGSCLTRAGLHGARPDERRRVKREMGWRNERGLPGVEDGLGRSARASEEEEEGRGSTGL